MNGTETLFVGFFLAYFAAFFAKLYNVMSYDGKTQEAWYSLKVGFLLFIVSVMCWGAGFVVVLHNASTLWYGSLFKLMTWSLVLHVGFMVAELFFWVSRNAVGAIGAHLPERRSHGGVR